MVRPANRARTVFACAECGHQSPKWLGQCPACRQWNTLQEEVAAPEPRAGAAPRGWGTASAPKPIALCEVEAREEERQRTGIGELDRVLGGGVVPGSLVLLGGDPGIGKSTLLLAALDRLAAATPDRPVLYVSGYTGGVLANRGVLPPDVNLLLKPFSARVLVATVQKLLREKK